jgi:hypothetical protein
MHRGLRAYMIPIRNERSLGGARGQYVRGQRV